MGSGYTSDYKRAKVVTLRDGGATYPKIERKTGVKQSTAHRLCDQHFDTHQKTYVCPKGCHTKHPSPERCQILADIDTSC